MHFYNLPSSLLVCEILLESSDSFLKSPELKVFGAKGLRGLIVKCNAKLLGKRFEILKSFKSFDGCNLISQTIFQHCGN